MSAMVARGGIDLGGTKIQAVVVDGKLEGPRQARRPTPTNGGPADVAEKMAEALREAAARGRSRARASSPASASARPATSTRRPARCPRPATCPGWEGTFPLGRAAREARSARRSRSATTSRWPPTRSSSSGPARPYKSLLGVFWGTGVGGGHRSSTASRGSGRAAAGEIGHMVVKTDGARCTCGRRGCMEAYAGRAAMEIKARKEHRRAASTRTCSRS